MSVTNKTWNGSASRWPDTASYCDSCAINTNTGDRDKWVQSECKLPYKEPNGDINTNALSSAAAALSGARGGVQSNPSDRRKAARAIIRGYQEAKMPPPDSLKKIAGK